MTAAPAELPLAESQPASKQCPVWLCFLLGALVGLSGYFALGFDHVFKPHHIDWIFHFTEKEPYYDPGTYFLGWNYFRHAPWTLPPGTNRDYGMEFGGAIVYSDSVPLMAFVLKPFSRWLGPIFQYQGVWILVCFLLQGAFASLLAFRFVRHLGPNLLIAAFFVLSPTLMERGWNQYAHMGQWLILWSLYVYLRDRQQPIRWIWGLLAMLGVLTSFYYVPMVLAIWAADAIKAALIQRRPILKLAIEAGMMICVTLGTMWLAGYFTISLANADTQDFGKFSTNLLGLIDPWGFGLFMIPLPKSPLWIGEGFCYLGLGMLVLGASAFVELLKSPPSRRAVVPLLPLIAMLLGLTLFSLSNHIAFGGHVLALPAFWWRLGAIFRASGRMIWPVYYALWLAIFYLTIRYLRPPQATLVLAVALCIQLVDLSPLYLALRNRYVTPRHWRSPLKDPFWAAAAHKYKRISVIPSGVPFAYAPIALLGSNNGIPTNAASLARYPYGEVIDRITDARIRALLDDKPDRETIYIVPPDDLFQADTRNLTHEHGVGRINGYNVVAPYWFADGHAVGPGDIPPGTAH